MSVLQTYSSGLLSGQVTYFMNLSLIFSMESFSQSWVCGISNRAFNITTISLEARLKILKLECFWEGKELSELLRNYGEPIC